MEDSIKFKKNEAGETVVITSETVEKETPLDSIELRRQIDEQAVNLAQTQRLYEAAMAFEASEKEQDTVRVDIESTTPIVNVEVLDAVRAEAPVEEVSELNNTEDQENED